MPLTRENKTEVIQSYRTHDVDTGSPEVQIALLTKRIEARLAENLEEKRQSEQFTVLEKAIPPATPFKPNRPMVMPLSKPWRTSAMTAPWVVFTSRMALRRTPAWMARVTSGGTSGPMSR